MLVGVVLLAGQARAAGPQPQVSLVQDDDDDEDRPKGPKRRAPSDDSVPQRPGLLGTFLSMGTGCCCGSGFAAGTGCCLSGCGCALAPLSVVRDGSTLQASLVLLAITVPLGGLMSLVGAVLMASNLGGFITIAAILYKMGMLNLGAAMMMFSSAAT